MSEEFQNYLDLYNYPDHYSQYQSGIGRALQHCSDEVPFEGYSLANVALAVAAAPKRAPHTLLPLVEVVLVPLVS